MRLPISACIYPVTLRNDNWQYLLLKRAPLPAFDLTAFWQGVTGAVEQGESVAQTASRELYEETAISPISIEAINCVYSYPIIPAWQYRYPPGVTMNTEHVFVAIIDTPQVPTLSAEHTDYQWCYYDQAAELLFFEENKQALKLCADYLNTHA